MVRFTITNIEIASYKKSVGRDRTEPAEMRVLTLVPITGPDAPDMGEHVPWHGSPDGRIRVAVDDPAAFAKFQLNGEFYLDLTPIRD
jgi:hypothetical protein